MHSLLKNTKYFSLYSANVQCEVFRALTLTTDFASETIPRYKATDWELLRRYVKACEQSVQSDQSDDVDDVDDARNDDTLQNDARDDTLPNRTHSAHCQLGFPSCNVGGVPGGKADMNNCGGIASDFIGGSWTYPEATYADRKAVWCVNIVVYIIL